MGRSWCDKLRMVLFDPPTELKWQNSVGYSRGGGMSDTETHSDGHNSESFSHNAHGGSSASYSHSFGKHFSMGMSCSHSGGGQNGCHPTMGLHFGRFSIGI